MKALPSFIGEDLFRVSPDYLLYREGGETCDKSYEVYQQKPGYCCSDCAAEREAQSGDRCHVFPEFLNSYKTDSDFPFVFYLAHKSPGFEVHTK